MKNKVIISILFALTSLFIIMGILFTLMMISFMLPFEYTINSRVFVAILVVITALIYYSLMKCIEKAEL